MKDCGNGRKKHALWIADNSNTFIRWHDCIDHYWLYRLSHTPPPSQKIWKESSFCVFSLTLFCLCVYMCTVSNGAIETLSVEWISRIDLKPTQPQGIIAHFLSFALFFPFLMKQISFLFSPETDHLLLWSHPFEGFPKPSRFHWRARKTTIHYAHEHTHTLTQRQFN